MAMKAKRATGKSSNRYFAIVKSWVRTYDEELRIGAAAAAVAFFFTHGLPLWNDDYSQWLDPANGGFFQLVWRFLIPFTWEPQTWGFSDRPGQILIYKTLSLVFGTWGPGFYFVKSRCLVLYFLLRLIQIYYFQNRL